MLWVRCEVEVLVFDRVGVKPILANHTTEIAFRVEGVDRQGKQGRLARLGEVTMEETGEYVFHRTTTLKIIS